MEVAILANSLDGARIVGHAELELSRWVFELTREEVTGMVRAKFENRREEKQRGVKELISILNKVK